MLTFQGVLNTISNSTDKDFIQFCSNWGLIPHIEREAPNCPKCGQKMPIYYSHQQTDGAIFRCCRCKTKRAVRQNAWTRQSQLSLRTIAKILAYWCEDHALDVASSHIPEATYNTIMDWFHEFSRLAGNAYVTDILARPLGAAKVEIDESHFFKAKHNVGASLALPQLWVFGVIDTGNGRVLLEPVEKRDAETLIPIIERCIARGSVIHSDCWGAYVSLGQRGYHHATVNHKEHFVDPDTGACTNGIEGIWGVVKGWMRKRMFRRCRSTFVDHLREWGFRRNIGKTFEACWRAIAGV